MSADGIDALLFDLGGVLLDIDFDRALARWAECAACDPALLRGRFSHDEAYKRHEIGAIGADEYFASLRASLGIDISNAEFLAGWNAIFVGEMPGMAELLAKAAERYPLYIFSNTNPAHEFYWSRRFAGLLKHFKEIFVSSSIGLRKPDSAAYRAVVQAIAVPAERVLFFDDLQENVAGAQTCGLRAFQVRSSTDVARVLGALGF
jgi:putative hydrolase of the HAD superfamily